MVCDFVIELWIYYHSVNAESADDHIKDGDDEDDCNSDVVEDGG